MKGIQSILFILSCLMLSSCIGNSPEDDSPVKPEPVADQEPAQQPVQEKQLKPLQVEQNSFMRVIDWIDHSKVLILGKSQDGNQLYLYDIFSGEQTVLYTDSEYIVDAKVSPDKEQILIHTAPLTYSATITVVDLKGNEVFKKDIESYEITYEWNEDKTDLILITSFSEDWSYQTLVADISEGSLTKMDAPQPFLKWNGENAFLYQDWPIDNISLTAPLYSQNIYSDEKVLVEEKVVHFNTYDSYVLSVAMNEEAEGEGIYKFITEDGTIQSSFDQPLLSSYSNWLIPYYDMIESEDDFITLTASESMPADSYEEKYTLMKWDVETGEREEIITGLENEPLQCSPDGHYCLTGYELKDAVDLSSKEKIDLIIFE